MLTFIIALVLGFLLLLWSANRFADEALLLGQHLNLSKILIGIVILGFGTSAPELLVSAISAWQGNPGLAIGNAIGSNITNITLVLGVTLCILPLVIYAEIVRRNFLLLLAATILLTVLIYDHQLTFLDGLILLLALLITLYVLSKCDGEIEHAIENIGNNKPTVRIIFDLIVGLVVLLLSSKLVVWAAVGIAKNLGVSDLIIGLTIIALGTSLPEIATCVASALKKHSELALGNVVGSNIFNTLGVTATASLITSYSLPDQVFTRDYPAMLFATAILFALVLIFLRKKYIPRIFGLLFLSGYLVYMYFIYIQSI